MTWVRRPSSRIQTIPAPGQAASRVSDAMRSAVRAGYAAARVDSNWVASIRVARVERRTRSLLTLAGLVRPTMSSVMEVEASESAFSLAQRICCSRRRSWE